MVRQQTMERTPNEVEGQPPELEEEMADSSRPLWAEDNPLPAILERYPDLKDVPAAVILGTGMYGGDCAGGCG